MNYADYVLKSNAIFTGLSENVISGGVAICKNRIAAVGDESKINPLIGPDTKIYEFHDELVMPGFNDSHVHLPDASLLNDRSYCVDVSACKSEEECVDLVEAFAAANPDNEWIFGWGWIEWNWDQPIPPTYRSLERIKTDRPICLQACHMHTAWLNKKALEICGITQGTPDPKGGKIGRFESGEPNGVLYEAEGVLLATNRAFDLPDSRLKSAFLGFLRHASSYGITSIGDVFPRGVAKENAYNLYQALSDDGVLPARIHFFSEMKYDLSDAKEYRSRFCSEKVRFCGLKQFIDGVPENHTGYFLEPYIDDPSTRGFLAIPEDNLKEMIVNADREGFPVRLHAMGDAAVRLGLDCFEAALKLNGRKGLRHALEHVENITAADIQRFQELGVTASMQPRHFTLNIDGHPGLVGEERSEFFYSLKSIVNTGASYAHGSDAPVSELNPIAGIYAGVTRMTETGYPEGGNNPKEKVSMYEILKGYTSGSAYIENFEDRIGTLEEGKLADIIVLSKNLFVIPYNEILETKVRLTLMDGNVVYSDSSLVSRKE